MKFESTPEQQANVAKLREFFETQRDGEELPWLRIEHETGIKMDAKGRNMVRNVLKSVRGRGGYGSVRGEGVIIASPGNAMAIVNNHGRHVGRAIKNWGKVVENTRDRYLDAMNGDDKQALIGRVAFVGALKTLAQGCQPKQLKAGK